MYEHDRKWGPLSLTLMVAGGVVLGVLALSVAFWVLHIVAGVVFALLRIGVLVAVAAGIVWLVRFLFRDRQHA
jgi:hypothetical protein